MSLAEQLRNYLNNILKNVITLDDLRTLLVSLLMITFWILLAYFITKIFKVILFKTKSLEKKETMEQQTIKRLINNVVRFFFIFWILVMILNEVGFDLIPLLAGAGVLAFAVGFGAQELIKDVISGMFLIEKTFKIGDNIEVGNNSGKVIDVGLKVKLENWRGWSYYYNGDIKTVKNRNINLLCSYWI